MKHLIIAIAVLTSLSASAQSGVDAMAKQRAKDLANQSAHRSLDVPTARPPAAARPGTPNMVTTPLTAGQQAFAQFQSQLFSVNTNSPASTKGDLARAMGNVALGANKPSQGTLNKLSDHLTTALNESKLSAQNKTRLAQDVGVLLNSANTPPVQKDAMIKDVQSILQTGGASSENASAVAADLQAVTNEVKTAAK
jgi:hypothetical protein